MVGSSIQQIDIESIHRICSSQVIIDLSTALKEMVENALDSGATTIEVKLKNFGADSIEVSDNGKGIKSEDYGSIAQKHHTSKITKFEDLEGVSSFGFRGEALNALCELSGKFVIVTKRQEDKYGATLTFDKFGKLSTQTVSARSVGTTILVENLFESLPVRRSEYLRNIKKQYQKAIKSIQAYALFSVGVKISLSNTSNGARQVVLSSQLSTKLEENISNLFGSKFLSSLIHFNLEVTADDLKETNADSLLEKDEDKEEDTEEQKTEEKNVEDNIISSTLPSDDIQEEDSEADVAEKEDSFRASLHGWVSKVGVGVGRSDNDRQYIFCNGRPVDLPKVVKALNEIWRKYEMKQKPAFIIDLRVSAGSIDVNVTPDKREIILKNENVIIERLKTIVDELYSPVRSTFEANRPILMTSFLNSQSVEKFTPEVRMTEDITTESTEVRSSPINSEQIQSSSSLSLHNLLNNNGTQLESVAKTTVWSSPLEKIRFSPPSSQPSSTSNNFRLSLGDEMIPPIEKKRSFHEALKSFSSFSSSSGTALSSSELNQNSKLKVPRKGIQSFLSFSQESRSSVLFSDTQTISNTSEVEMEISPTEKEVVDELVPEDSLNPESVVLPATQFFLEEINTPSDEQTLPSKPEVNIFPSQTQSNGSIWSINPEEILSGYQKVTSSRRKRKPGIAMKGSTASSLEEAVENNIREESYKTLKKQVKTMISFLLYDSVTHIYLFV
jgi:DNA mismatch repair protein MutL